MAAAEWPITIEENSTFHFYIRKMVNKCTAQDITGWGARVQIREAKSPLSTILYEANAPAQISIQEGGELGLFHIALPITTINSPGALFTKAYWDMLVWDGTGSITSGAIRLIQGPVKWSAAVTHP